VHVPLILHSVAGHGHRRMRVHAGNPGKLSALLDTMSADTELIAARNMRRRCSAPASRWTWRLHEVWNISQSDMYDTFPLAESLQRDGIGELRE
jgi:hypothetical protein